MTADPSDERQPTPRPLTAADIAEYLASSDDFAFEREIFSIAKGFRFDAQHAALYTDPVTGKPRQFDVRASIVVGQNKIALALECKKLTADYPLLVSCVPRARHESFHEFLYRDSLMGAGASFMRVQKVSRGTHQYPYEAGQPVAKSLRQVRRERKSKHVNRMVSGDDVFDKWTQALASIGEMVESGAHELAGLAGFHPVQRIAFIPALIVPDGTLWIADYSSTGELQRPPFQHDEITFHLERKYPLRREQTQFTVTHMHIFTRAALGKWLENMGNGGGVWDEVFPG